MLIDRLLGNKLVSFSVKPEQPGWSRAKRSSEAPQFSTLYKKVELKLRVFG